MPDRPFSAAAERNSLPILAVLQEHLPTNGLVLEVASGTGQHACCMAEHLPGIRWQPSERDAAALASLQAGLVDAPDSVAPALALDVTRQPWPLARADAVYTANLLHIAPWPVAEGLFSGAAGVLAAGAPLLVYGPFREDGQHTSAGNLAFDADLRQRDPAWGIRDREAVQDLAAELGFQLRERVAMPANNLCLVFQRR